MGAFQECPHFHYPTRRQKQRSNVMIWTVLSLLALAAWTALLLSPAHAHRTRERLEASGEPSALDDVTVLIPARNEEVVIEDTLTALAAQGPGLEILVVNDGSSDGTRRIAERHAQVIDGKPLPLGWGGKLWALEQGLTHVTRRYTLLLDADIVLAPGMIETLRSKAQDSGARLVSIMALLRCAGFWERLLVPPFVFFFKALYPFAWVNNPRHKVAAAAGGCILVETSVLREVEAFASISDELIDDCALAGKVKGQGHAIWLGLSRSVRSSRHYATLGEFWSMVSRSAFTQLRYSTGWLLITSSLMLVVFYAPLLALALAPAWGVACGLLALVGMSLAVMPVIRFYGLSPLWALLLPVAATLYLLMTWGSALSYWRGTRATWKNRVYEVAG